MPKIALGFMNSNKNKLNSEIILIFNPKPNTNLIKSIDLIPFLKPSYFMQDKCQITI